MGNSRERGLSIPGAINLQGLPKPNTDENIRRHVDIGADNVITDFSAILQEIQSDPVIEWVFNVANQEQLKRLGINHKSIELHNAVSDLRKGIRPSYFSDHPDVLESIQTAITFHTSNRTLRNNLPDDLKMVLRHKQAQEQADKQFRSKTK